MWPNGNVPTAGARVVIPQGTNIVLDVSPPPLAGITIEGSLTFANQDLTLTTEWILLRGLLQIGTEAQPYTNNATITLTDNTPNESVDGLMGDRTISVMGGTLELHGNRTHTWTKLAATANAGSSTIQVLDASQWQVGDVIALASTDFEADQAEQKTIAAISGNSITLDSALQYTHFGEITYDVDQRGEVGLLSRNILIQSSSDSENNYKGGHVAVMNPGQMYISGVEFYRMGQHLGLGRYPVHWHIYGDATGQYVENSSMHRSYNRCVTVHGTHNVRVENNVTYNTVGHCFFLEDGVETGNRFIANLGILTKCHPTRACQPFNQGADDILLPSDNSASTYWITNPDNIFRDNVAAGAEEVGFWIALPERPTGLSADTPEAQQTWPRRTNIREFVGNVAHSNYDGMMFDRGPEADGTFAIAGNDHTAYADPTNTDSQVLTTRMSDFTAYKNRNNGVWARGGSHEFSNFRLADNAIGFTHADSGSLLLDSLFVGESDNMGNPNTSAEINYGRSLPREADYPVRGFEFYDFTNRLRNVTFRNYTDNATRNTGAISYLLYSDFPISTANSVEGLTFENAKPVFFPEMRDAWAFENSGKDGYRGAIFEDVDGSIGGLPGAYVVIDNPILTDQNACDYQPSWNAAVCQGDYGRLGFNFFGSSGGEPGTITLSRTGVGGSVIVNGFPFAFGGFSGKETTVRLGTEIEINTQNAVSSLSISLREGTPGSSIIMRVFGFNSATTGSQQSSLQALRNSGSNAWYAANGSVYVKLFATSGFGAFVTVN
ncbi:G8 domain-containing protein [Teredinibacter turnerae]|uniref:G8 domain-containing protein n=1 Tax=Teredinibacter turnerae TaxID=2426 RepID=UPI001E3C870D|nr:G8 domain-containing protein [Teredinibacter turnerae]